MTSGQRLGSAAVTAVGRALLWLYPRAFRRELGPSLIRDLRAEAADVVLQDGASFTLWLVRTTASLLSNAASEWTEPPDPRGLVRDPREEKAGRMDRFRQDLAFAVRALRRRPSFTAVAVITLALGIGSTTAMFSVVRGILLRPLPYPDSERIVTVWQTGLEDMSVRGGLLSHPNFRDIRDAVESLESIALVGPTNLTVTEEGGAEIVSGAQATPGLFEVMGVSLAAGRDFTDVENRYQGPRVVIVAAEYWRDRFGVVEDAVGSTIRIAGQPHLVVGVAPPGFDYPDYARLWIPAQNDEERCRRGCLNRGSVARLADGASLETARRELDVLGTRLAAEYPSTNEETRFASTTLHEVTVGDVRPALWLLLGAVGTVLLIACANVANLILVRGNGRVTEIAIRSTLGAHRGRILQQLMTESALIAALGGVVGLGLAAYGVGALVSLAPADIPRLDEVGLDAIAVGFAAVLVVATTAIFGAAPALLVSSVRLAGSLGGGDRGDVTRGRSGRARSAILTLEVALSVLLLVGAGLLVRSLARTMEVDPGFDGSDVALFRLSLPRARFEPEARVDFMDRLQTRLEGLPGVESATVFVGPPLSYVGVFGGFRRTDVAALDEEDSPLANWRAAGPGALEALGIPIVAGRGIGESDRRESEPVVLVSQRLVDLYFPDVDPVGRHIEVQVSTGFDEVAPRRIVGVVGDFRAARLRTEAGPELIIPYSQAGSGFPHVLLEGPSPAGMLELAREELRALDPEVPLMQPSTVGDLVARELAQPRFYFLLLGLLAAMAVVLAGVGMYGVIAYAVSQRTKEIGVRMALGARGAEVVQLVLGQALRPSVVGVVVGLVAAIWLGDLMRGLLYEVAPRDPLTLVGVPVVLLLVVVAACAIPARRATRVSPSSALRGE